MSSPVFKLRKQAAVASKESHRFRVAVFGQKGVGKTALTVRFVTNRFIGEYDSTQDRVYQRACRIPPGFSVFYEILDSTGQDENDDVLTEKILWADSFIIVYSVTDRLSFDEVIRLKFRISHTSSKKSTPDPVTFIVGNKNEMQGRRMVERDEGLQLANSIDCEFHEISVRESSDETCEIFAKLFRDHWMTLKLPQRMQRGAGSGVQIPTMPEHFSPLPNRRKNKTFKHVDKIPRLRGSPTIFRDSATKPDVAKHDAAKTPTQVKQCKAAAQPAAENKFEDEECLTTSGAGEESRDPKKVAEEFVRKTILLNLAN